MKKRISCTGLWLFVLIVLSGTLNAQGITGDWQGTLVIGKLKLRTILKVSNGPDHKLAADFYSIDQTTDAHPVDALSLDGTNVRFALPAIQVSYEGNRVLNFINDSPEPVKGVVRNFAMQMMHVESAQGQSSRNCFEWG